MYFPTLRDPFPPKKTNLPIPPPMSVSWPRDLLEGGDIKGDPPPKKNYKLIGVVSLPLSSKPTRNIVFGRRAHPPFAPQHTVSWSTGLLEI